MKNINLLFAIAMSVIVCMVAEHFGYKLTWWQVLGVAMACWPWETNDHDVYSLFGGVSEGSIYSLVPIFQIANSDAVGLVGPCIIQTAGDSAGIVCGATLIQTAKYQSTQIFGLIVFQNGRFEAVTRCCITGIQISDSISTQVCGLMGVQYAPASCKNGFGFGLIQVSQRIEGNICVTLFRRIIGKNPKLKFLAGNLKLSNDSHTVHI